MIYIIGGLVLKFLKNEYYYIIDLNNIFLPNKMFQLDKGLKNVVVNFYSKNGMKYIESRLKKVDLISGGLIFHETNSNIHVVDITKPIKISKLHISR